MFFKSILTKKFFFLFSLLLLFLGGRFVFAQEVSVVTIKSADSSAYKKNDKTEEDEIILSGNVCILVEKDEDKTEIKADTISFNRATKMLYAKGSVEVVKYKDDGGTQSITAETVLLNTSTLEGIFDGGRVVQLSGDDNADPSISTLIVASKIFGQDSAGTVAFKKADLTFCDDDNPHWKIKASRIWLLPGGEFAFLNAVVFVGKIPIFYIPAFYYPKDELLFNPAFGYDERTGYYFNTTTYLIGRKPLQPVEETEDSFSLMRETSLKEQKREGLVMHNLDKKYTGDTTNFLKIMADYYTNLGFLVGAAEVYRPDSEYISSIESSFKFGFTDTIFYSNGWYTPFDKNGKMQRDKADFLGVETPFRYGADINVSLKKPFKFDLSLPVYSDPFFTEDFETRSEYLDWINFLLGSYTSQTDEDDTSAQTTSFDWDVDMSYSFPIPEILTPFVTDISITSLSANIAFNSKSRSDDDFIAKSSAWRYQTPERSFFYPSQVTPFKISAKIEGTLIQYPFENTRSKKDEIEFPIELDMPEELKTEKQKEEENKSEEIEEKNENITEENEIAFTLRELEGDLDEWIPSINGIIYSLSYSVEPQFTSQFTYNSSDLYKSSDFEWSNFYSTYYQVESPLTLSSDFSLRDPFFSAKNEMTFDPLYQTHPNLDGYTSESSKNSVKLSDYSARKLDLISTNTFAVNPLAYSEVFRESSISWNTKVKIIRTDFIGDAENPEWSYATMDLTNDDTVTIHNVSATLAAREMGDFAQTLTLTSNLPPQLNEYTMNTTLDFPHLTVAAEAGLEQEYSDSNDYTWNPFKQSATIKFFNENLKFTESFNYEIEENHPDSLKLSLSWKNLQLAYTMQYTSGYDFDEDDGWVERSKMQFLPYTVSLAYGTPDKRFRYWKSRITWAPSVTVGLVYDCIQPTNSYFRFVPSMTFRIHDEFDLTFSAETQNNVIFRYIQKYTKYKNVISGEENIFVDLWNSFSFWGNGNFYDPDQTKRRSSGFKLKSLEASIKRNLHDWDLYASISFKPRAVTDGDKYEYDYHPYISFSISWHPMPSFKTEVIDEYGEWQLK